MKWISNTFSDRGGDMTVVLIVQTRKQQQQQQQHQQQTNTNANQYFLLLRYWTAN